MGWVGSIILDADWVGLGRVQSNMISCQTALVIISCNHDYHERDFSAVSRTITDWRSRSRLSPKNVEAMELIRWAVRGSLLNMDD